MNLFVYLLLAGLTITIISSTVLLIINILIKFIYKHCDPYKAIKINSEIAKGEDLLLTLLETGILFIVSSGLLIVLQVVTSLLLKSIK